MATKNKLPRNHDESYARYEDGRFTFSMKIEDCSHQRYVKDGKDLIISPYESHGTVIGPLNLLDLKALRKLIRKAIRNYESNEPFQV